MTDLTDKRLIYLKAILFFVGGVLASALLLLERQSWKDAALLALAIWCFARLYYFAFYVIEHYVDASFRYAGLLSFLRYWMKNQASSKIDEQNE